MHIVVSPVRRCGHAVATLVTSAEGLAEVAQRLCPTCQATQPTPDEELATAPAAVDATALLAVDEVAAEPAPVAPDATQKGLSKARR